MRYQILAQVYEDLASTTKRLEKIDILAKFLLKVPDEDNEVLYLIMGDIYAEYREERIGISNQLASKAIAKATGTSEKKVTDEWKRLGDLGEVAQKLTQGKSQSTLHSTVITVKKVLDNLRKLPVLEGKGSVDKKLALITELLTSASPIEARYLVRTLLGDLRIGIKESTVRESLAKAFFKLEEEQKAAEIIQDAIDKSNDVVKVFAIAKKGEIKEFAKIDLEVGKPIKAMLAQKVTTIPDAFKALGTPLAVEYKYDGFRLLIHKKGKEITLFTRRLENVTKQFPEVIEYINTYVKGNSFILDSEAVGFDKKTKEYKPFQEISQRIRRKYDIEQLQDKLPVEVNVFDILYYNGKSMLAEPFKKRTEKIKQIINQKPYKIIHSKQIITDSQTKAEKFYKEALKDNQEGVMFKNLDAHYKPGRRVGHMLKIKPEVKDLDLVITGGEWGTGKRKGWLSSFIISCYDEKNHKYVEIGKVGTGIKEKEEGESGGISFAKLTELVKPHIIKESGKKVTIKPKVVVSLTYQEIQHSPNYNSGYALRFPRFTALREDKHLKEITTLKEIEEDVAHQKRNWQYG